MGGHRDDVGAVGRNTPCCVRGTVAGRDHHDGAASDRRIDGVLEEPIARRFATKGHIDDPGRARIGWYATHGPARCPGDRIGDVGQEPSANAQDTDGLDLGIRRNSGNADVVVGDGRDGPRDMRAVPTGGKAWLPISGIQGNCVTAGTVVRYGHVANEVVTVNNVGIEVGMHGDACVEDRHDYSGPSSRGPDFGCPGAVTPIRTVGIPQTPQPKRVRVVGKADCGLDDDVGCRPQDCIGPRHLGGNPSDVVDGECLTQGHHARRTRHVPIDACGDINAQTSGGIVGDGFHGGVGDAGAGGRDHDAVSACIVGDEILSHGNPRGCGKRRGNDGSDGCKYSRDTACLFPWHNPVNTRDSAWNAMRSGR